MKQRSAMAMYVVMITLILCLFPGAVRAQSDAQETLQLCIKGSVGFAAGERI